MEHSLLSQISNGDVIEMDLESSFTYGLEYIKQNIEYIFSHRKWVDKTALYSSKKKKILQHYNMEQRMISCVLIEAKFTTTRKGTA